MIEWNKISMHRLPINAEVLILNFVIILNKPGVFFLSDELCLFACYLSGFCCLSQSYKLLLKIGTIWLFNGSWSTLSAISLLGNEELFLMVETATGKVVG